MKRKLLDQLAEGHDFPVPPTMVEQEFDQIWQQLQHEATHEADPEAAMAELESLCAGLAAERMTSTERYTLATVHENLRALIQAGDPQRYHEINEAFHGAIYTGAHNAYLAELTIATRTRVQPFRRAQFRNLGRLAKSHVEHDRVVVGIMRGDRARAASAMRDHIETVRDEFAAYIGSLRADPAP